MSNDESKTFTHPTFTSNSQQSSSSPDCRKCMSNLISTLNAIQSKPMAIFQAMGVNVASYEQNETGVQVHVPSSSPINSSTTTISTRNSSSNKTSQDQEGFGGGTQSNNSTCDINDNSRNSNNAMMGTLKSRLTKTFQKASSQSPPVAVATSARTKPAIQLQIVCQKCGNDGPEGGARAYVKGPHPLSIVLCSNRLSTREEIEQVLVHELMHVYDVHYRNWDLTNCYTLAKSEVRAAREAECADATMSFTKRYCVKEKARLATKNIFPDVGLQCVAAVFEEAMKDKGPFFDKEKSGKHESTMQGRSFQSTYPGDARRQ